MEGHVRHARHGSLHAHMCHGSLHPHIPTPPPDSRSRNRPPCIWVLLASSASLVSAAFSASRRRVSRRHVVLAPLPSRGAKHDAILAPMHVLAPLHVHLAQTYVMHRKLFEIDTPYQNLCVYDSPSLGRVLALDGSLPPPPSFLLLPPSLPPSLHPSIHPSIPLFLSFSLLPSLSVVDACKEATHALTHATRVHARTCTRTQTYLYTRQHTYWRTGVVQLTERFEANYHEIMAHVPVNILLGPQGVPKGGLLALSPIAILLSCQCDDGVLSACRPHIVLSACRLCRVC